MIISSVIKAELEAQCLSGGWKMNWKWKFHLFQPRKSPVNYGKKGDRGRENRL